MRKTKKRGSKYADADGSNEDVEEDPNTALPLTRYNTMLAVQRNTLFMCVIKTLTKAMVVFTKVKMYVRTFILTY